MPATSVKPAPQTLRASLEHAVADGRALLKRDRRIAPDVGVWHEAARDGRPHKIGAAGAVMAMTLGVGPKEYAAPGHFAPRWRAALLAIEAARAGNWAGAWQVLYGRAGTSLVPDPPGEFAHRIANALERASNETREIATRQAYAAWLEHIEHEALGPLGDIEETLSRALEPARAPPAPETLAHSLRLALADGTALARRSRGAGAQYLFYSGAWHTGGHTERNTCAVCAAGSVMAGTLASPRNATLEPRHFAQTWAAALEAIQEMRVGHWRSAFGRMHGSRHPGREGFRNAMARRVGYGIDRRTIEGGAFATHAQYEAWLEHVRTHVLPAVGACEAHALARR